MSTVTPRERSFFEKEQLARRYIDFFSRNKFYGLSKADLKFIHDFPKILFDQEYEITILNFISAKMVIDNLIGDFEKNFLIIDMLAYVFFGVKLEKVKLKGNKIVIPDDIIDKVNEVYGVI